MSGTFIIALIAAGAIVIGTVWAVILAGKREDELIRRNYENRKRRLNQGDAE